MIRAALKHHIMMDPQKSHLASLMPQLRHRTRGVRFDIAAHDRKAHAHNAALRYQERLEAKGDATQDEIADLERLWKAAFEAGIAYEQRPALKFKGDEPSEEALPETPTEADDAIEGIPDDAPPAVKAAAKRKAR